MGDEIRELRDAYAITQAELSAICGTPASNVDQWERNITVPDMLRLEILDMLDMHRRVPHLKADIQAAIANADTNRVSGLFALHLLLSTQFNAAE